MMLSVLSKKKMPKFKKNPKKKQIFDVARGLVIAHFLNKEPTYCASPWKEVEHKQVQDLVSFYTDKRNQMGTSIFHDGFYAHHRNCVAFVQLILAHFFEYQLFPEEKSDSGEWQMLQKCPDKECLPQPICLDHQVEFTRMLLPEVGKDGKDDQVGEYVCQKVGGD